MKPRFDFSHLNSDDNALPVPGKFDFSGLNSVAPVEKPPEMENTIFGKMPKDLKKNMPQFQPGTPENEEFIKNFINTAAGAPAMNVVGQGVKTLLTPINAKGLAYGVQKAHDVMAGKASDLYNFVKDEAGIRGVNKVPVPDSFIDEASRHLPKTQATKDLIEAAKTGDYQALHELQSDLGKRGTKALGSELHADRNAGEEMLDSREKINDDIIEHFKNSGHPYLADALTNAKSIYRNMKEIYYSEPRIAKLVHSETREVPKNPLTVFSKESKPMKKLLENHPEITDAINLRAQKDKLMKYLNIGKNVALIGGGGAAALNYGPSLINKLLGD